MITCSNIGFGNQLGAQMTNFADLYYIAKENNQSVKLLSDFRYFRRGYQFVEVFDFPDNMLESDNNRGGQKLYNNLLNSTQGNWKSNFAKIYKNRWRQYIDHFYTANVYRRRKELVRISDLKGGVECDKRLLKLDENRFYDICDGFGTIKEWDKYRDDIIKIFSYKPVTKDEGDSLWREKVENNKKDGITTTCSIHFRRTDYLLISSLNLSDDYYKAAIDKFDKDKTLFVVFSDDIDAVRNLDYLQNLNAVFMERNSAIMDMYLMSKCDNNIIANSSFSFWGAYLGDDSNRKVVCPHDFIGDSAPEVQYMNGNWYPENWIALDLR
ncbi:Glycosyl transferase family 11 [Pseudobutyrivibrio sp. 49]|uniref:alpha-1,2-fucosyltransferase n=1 Tax=Pseudobutyrivibrio sp. 49 TaxID=1855344 RepID=UPI0008811301|nr:alpha-1,2-fucosyltransferase [Pseudobutyrivibrio sp. 49]SDH60382.1 Glycosyl transferase family 11 [Pseudobutyrivibrio sp. 49]